MASPPTTPTYSRRQSADLYKINVNSPGRPGSIHSRRSSSAYSPSHSRLGSSHGPSGGNSLANELGGDFAGESLADELGGWSEAGEEEDEDEYSQNEDADEEAAEHSYVEQERDSGIDVTSSPAPNAQNGKLLTVQPKGHRRQHSDYDGSEYGSESDFEESQLVSASLEARLAAVESLARRGTGDVSGQENIIARATEQMKDLGGQAEIETGVARYVLITVSPEPDTHVADLTRLTTAHSAIATHLANQSRIVSQFTASIFGPFAPSLSEEVIEDLLPAITATLSAIPTIAPAPQPATSLHSLTTSTADVLDALSTLADTLQMNRQTSITATRRLRTVKDTLREFQTEWNVRDDAVRWIEQGCWDQKLKDRECASACRDIIGGFEETCNLWRKRLEGSNVAAG
jgi:hypothetical protein